MKRLLSFLGIALFLSTGLLQLHANAFTLLYEGPDHSNAFATKVISGFLSDVSEETAEETTDAISLLTNDVKVGGTAGEVFYVGYGYEFDGISLDISTSASGGAYTTQYWDGNSWETLISNTSASIANSSGVLSLEWDRPSDWSTTFINMDTSESGTNVSSGNLYFVRLLITSSYSTQAYASQVGVLQYNAEFNLENEAGTGITGQLNAISFVTSNGDATIYASDAVGNGTYKYALYTPTNTTYTYYIEVPGYGKESNGIGYNPTSTQTVDATLDTAYLVILNNSSGTKVTNATVKAGDNLDITCTNFGSGRYGCVVPISNDDGDVRVTASGYVTETFNFTSVRDNNSDSQVADTFWLTSSSSSSSSNGALLIVDDIEITDDGDLQFRLENQGTDSVASTTDVEVVAEVNSDEVWSKTYNNSSTTSFLDEGEDDTITAGYNFFDDFDAGDLVDVSVCINGDSDGNYCVQMFNMEVPGAGSSSGSSVGDFDCGEWDDVSSIYMDVMNEVCEEGIMSGNNTLFFGSNYGINRAEAATVGNRLLMGTNDYNDIDHTGTYYIDSLEHDFSDLPPNETWNEWILKAMYYASANGVMSGDDNGRSITTFRPTDEVTAAEFLKILLESAKNGDLLIDTSISGLTYDGTPWYDELMGIYDGAFDLFESSNNQTATFRVYYDGNTYKTVTLQLNESISRRDVAFLIYEMLRRDIMSSPN